MIHIIDDSVTNFYYNKDDRKFYFVNENARYNNVVAEAAEGIEPEMVSCQLPVKQFSVIKKKGNYWIVPEENLSNDCFYIGEFVEEGCNNMSINDDYTNCKIVGCFLKKIKSKCVAQFAVIFRSCKYITFDITLSSGEKFKRMYAFNTKTKDVLCKTVDDEEWNTITERIMLNDYEENYKIEVNLEFLETLKDRGFTIKKWGG